MFSRIQERVTGYMEEYIASSITGYSSVHTVNHECHIMQRSAEYVLFPVWIVYYDYDHSEYTFAMNGQTGKIAGMPPLNKAKAISSMAAVTLLLFIICRIITVLMGGPVL